MNKLKWFIFWDNSNPVKQKIIVSLPNENETIRIRYWDNAKVILFQDFGLDWQKNTSISALSTVGCDLKEILSYCNLTLMSANLQYKGFICENCHSHFRFAEFPKELNQCYDCEINS